VKVSTMIQEGLLLDFNTLGKRVRQVRTDLGYTQRELGTLAKLGGHNYPSEIERGVATGVTLDAMMSIAQALSTDGDVQATLNYLLFGRAEEELPLTGWTRELLTLAASLPEHRQVDLLLIARVFREIDVAASQTQRLQHFLSRDVDGELESVVEEIVGRLLSMRGAGDDS